MPSREERAWQHYEVEKARNTKAMKKIRQEIKRNRPAKRTRRKDWRPDDFDELDELDELAFPHSKRGPAGGERKRRHPPEAAVLSELEDEEFFEELSSEVDRRRSPDAATQKGVVTQVSSGLCRVDLGERSLVCTLRGSLDTLNTGFSNIVAVGDEVLILPDGADQGVIEAVLPRRNALTRPDVADNHRQQLIVANADQLLIVVSWRNPPIWLELIDRYLIAAERNGLSPLICLNKIDLAESVAVCRAKLQPYLDLNYRVLFTSTLTGDGIKALRKSLRGQATVLAGLSGVGKSSLAAAIQPGLQLRIGEVNEDRGEGRHTTTQATWWKLEMGGAIIDTPGIREFGLSGLRREDLTRYYPEIGPTAGRCHFVDCTHTHEPDCAVKAAVQQGHIAAARYHNYKKIFYTL